MKMKSLLMMAAFACSLGMQAQKEAAAVADPKGGNETTELLRTAGELVQYGYRTKTALPLVQAVEIYNRLGVGDASTDRSKTEESEAVTAGQATTGKDNALSHKPSQILADATKYAEGNKAMLALIKQMGGERGRVGGPTVHDDIVKPNTTDVYNITFRGGEYARITVNGDGDTDLDLYVYDENGNLIDSDTDSTDYCVATFTPKWTGVFKVKIKNLGNVYNRYRLTTN